jgi:hypothetical protein
LSAVPFVPGEQASGPLGTPMLESWCGGGAGGGSGGMTDPGTPETLPPSLWLGPTLEWSQHALPPLWYVQLLHFGSPWHMVQHSPSLDATLDLRSWPNPSTMLFTLTSDTAIGCESGRMLGE